MDNIEQAIEYYQQALKVITRQAMPVEWAGTMMNLGIAYRHRIRGDRMDNIEQAIKCYQQALQVMTRQAMPVDWAQTINNLAIAYLERICGDRADNIEQAIVYCQQALEVRTRQDVPDDWAATINSLAIAYRRRIRGNRAENVEKAIEYHQQVLEVITRQAMPVEWAATIVNLATAYFERIYGDQAENIEQAIKYYWQALEVMTSQGMPVDWSTAMMNMATAYKNRIHGDRAENIEQAIKHYQQALEVRTRQAIPVEWAETMINLATAYAEHIRGDRMDNIEQAIEYYQQALKVMTRQTMPVKWSAIMMNLGSAYLTRIHGDRAENIEQAIKHYQQSLEVRTRQTMPIEWSETMMNLASAYSNRIRGDRMDNIEQAIEYYQQALKVMTRQAMPVKWAGTTMNLASAYLERIRGDQAENVEQAIKHYRRALEVMTCQAMPYNHLLVQRMIGNLCFDKGLWSEAVSAYRGALAAGNLLYQAAATPESRQAELHEIQHLPHRLAYALVKIAEQPETLEEATVALEQNRARWLSEVLELQNEKPPLVPENIWQALTDRREAMLRLLAETRMPESTPGKRDFLTLSKALKICRQALTTAISDVRKYAESFMPELSLSQIQEIASESPYPLVYLAITEIGTLALVLSSSTPVTSQICKVCSVWCDLTTEHLNNYLVQKDVEPATGYLPAQFGETNIDEVLKEILPSLGSRLMMPLANKLRQMGATGAVLIPGGLLSLLPLGAASIDGPLSTNRYAFLDEFDVAYAPSAITLGQSHRRLTRLDFNSQKAKLLAIGNPLHSGAVPLPFSAIEVQMIAEHFPSDRKCLLYGEQATREKILANAAVATVLHLACHGNFNPNRPLDSAMLLAENDRLTLTDILGDLSLESCRLVVLSACQTAITDFRYLPDEVIGLPAGFLSAGAICVLGSLWPVNDISTALLMERFYYFYQQKAQSPASALRAAQCWLRDVTNKELIHAIQTRKEAVLKQLPVSYRLDLDNFLKYANKNPSRKPFTSTQFWAPFTLHGT